MKFSTKARYGLRMMVELARLLREKPLVPLVEIADITGVSANYLAQLAMPLRHAGLLVGVSGQKGGYALGRPAEDIHLNEILEALQGPIALTDCSGNPDLCLYAPFCETRMIWVIAAHKMRKVFEEHSLADLIDQDFRKKTQEKFKDLPQLIPDIRESDGQAPHACTLPSARK